MSFELLFVINDRKPESQGIFQTEQDAFERMLLLIATKSSIISYYTRVQEIDEFTKHLDYGAHNAYYIIENTSKPNRDELRNVKATIKLRDSEVDDLDFFTSYEGVTKNIYIESAVRKQLHEDIQKMGKDNFEKRKQWFLESLKPEESKKCEKKN